jgi:hypothetical protein
MEERSGDDSQVGDVLDMGRDDSLFADEKK